VDKYRISCIKCGEKHVRMRKATNKMVSKRALRNMRVDVVVCSLTLIGLAFFGFLIVDYENMFFIHCSMVVVGIAVVLLLSWWFLRVRPLTRKPMHHYKCSKCAYTWDI